MASLTGPYVVANIARHVGPSEPAAEIGIRLVKTEVTSDRGIMRIMEEGRAELPVTWDTEAGAVRGAEPEEAVVGL